MAVTKVEFPKRSEVRELRPGFEPYVQARRALQPEVIANRQAYRDSPFVIRHVPNGRAIVRAIQDLVTSEVEGSLRPPLPEDIHGIMQDMTRVFSEEALPGVLNGESVLNDSRNCETAQYVLELAVAHGYSNLEPPVRGMGTEM